MRIILGIETSCDETAAALVADGVEVLASSLATSADMHIKSGGVIPEVAARKQVESIVPVVDECLRKGGVLPKDISALAATVGPGLIGSLVVGVEFAKALSLAWDKSIVPVNHLVGHIYGNFVGKNEEDIKFPAVVLIVSGGHTDLVLMMDHGKFEYIGGTLDDACGEAFDKAARILGLAMYLGGPVLSRAADSWDPSKSAFKFKRPMADSGDFNFSFSGIKTAVLGKANEGLETNEISYEFQEAVTDVLLLKTLRAAEKFDAKAVMLAGGVSANKVLREKFEKSLSGSGRKLFIPPVELCTDNAIYIASCAHFNFNPRALGEIKADPGLTVMSAF